MTARRSASMSTVRRSRVLPRRENLTTSTNPLTIGSDPIYGQYFQGMIDDVRVYNVALTSAQIQTDMATPVAGGGARRDSQPPSAPGTLTASAINSGRIDLSWGAATDNVAVAGYRSRFGGGGASRRSARPGRLHCEAGRPVRARLGRPARFRSATRHPDRVTPATRAGRGRRRGDRADQLPTTLPWPATDRAFRRETQIAADSYSDTSSRPVPATATLAQTVPNLGPYSNTATAALRRLGRARRGVRVRRGVGNDGRGRVGERQHRHGRGHDLGDSGQVRQGAQLQRHELAGDGSRRGLAATSPPR